MSIQYYCFLDDTNNSRFETTTKFCPKQTHMDLVCWRIEHMFLPYRWCALPTTLFVSRSYPGTLWLIILGGIWAKSRNSRGSFPTYFSMLKVQLHQSKAFAEQVSKHAYVTALKRCDWLFVEAILFNNVSRVNVVEQIPTAFCLTTFPTFFSPGDPTSV